MTRVRNEKTILVETLDHFAQYCDLGILVLDDCSTDDTAELSRAHPAVVEVLENDRWRENRVDEEWRLRQVLLDRGRRLNPDWFVYFDADERIELDDVNWAETEGVELRLFDAYITDEDAIAVGTSRRWFGPEYRDIMFFFRNRPWLSYHIPDQRVVAGVAQSRLGGRAKHYGKAVSIEQFEETCRYYIDHFPEPYASKWAARLGEAIHTTSDFGNPLYLWEDVANHGTPVHDARSSPRLGRRALELLAAATDLRYLCPCCQEALRLSCSSAGEVLQCTRGCSTID